MLLLALDTTLAACSAAIYDCGANQVLSHQHERMRQGHAERLAGMTEEVADDAGVGFDRLDRIAVTIGPGTFTGVRIGLAMARGLSVALSIPVIGVGTMQALAANVDDNPDRLPIAVIVDARRDAVYVQIFSCKLEPLSAPQCVKLDEVRQVLPVEDIVIVGSGTGLIIGEQQKWRASGACDLPDACSVAQIACNMVPSDQPPSPLYLRPADAKPQIPQIKLARLSIVISSVEPRHAAVLAEMHRECFAKAWSAKDFAKMMAAPGMSALMAIQAADEEPVGFVLLRQAAKEAEIITTCVRPRMRRRGVATGLMEQAMQLVKAAGVVRLFLEVREDNAAARALYRAAGFSETGRRANYYALEDGSQADAVTMAATL